MADRPIPEMNCLMYYVEKKFRKDIKTSTDFYSLAQEIEGETSESVSASTLKRMWGYVNMAPVPRQSTLDVLSRYIGMTDYKTFCEKIKDSEVFRSGFFTADFINSCDLPPEAKVEIGWNPDRKVTLRHIDGCRFEVESAYNSKLREGDLFEAVHFIKGQPLYISRIWRDGGYTPPYIAGRQGGLNHLKALEAKP